MADNIFRRAGVRYEVACDVIGALIAHHAEIIGNEREKEVPDQGVIQANEEAQRGLRNVREDLDARDSGAIEAVIAKYGPQARAAFQ